jgi:hypothetical protein
VKLAARGQRDMDTGPEPIADQAESKPVRRQTRVVYGKSIAAAAVLTAIALLA